MDADTVTAWLDAYPAEAPPPPAGTFEFGLCMAGAISAGAYTAGVFDLLFEALDAFEEAKQAGEVPQHRTILRVMGGSSAGGMCAALAAVFADRSFPARIPGSSGDNPLYAAWVTEADISGLLETDDLGAEALASLLNCGVLDRIVDQRLADRTTLWQKHGTKTRGRLPPDRLPVILMLANLRGIPYGLRFAGTPFAHFMRQHADSIRFALPLSSKVAPKPGEILMGDAFFEDRANRHAFRAAVLGTGAFPVALQARYVSQARDGYQLRAALHPSSPLGSAQPDPDVLRELRPAWPSANEDPITSLCVDGGTLDNEQLERVRRELAGWAGKNPRDGMEANRAVVLVDPFVNPGTEADARNLGLIGQLPAILGALMAQARFKPEELALAAGGTTYSRFIIAPSRGKDWHGEGAIAGGYLKGFMGFLSEAYRHHDFMLGRRNARSFLRNHFLLPEDNPLFGAWKNDHAAKERWGRRRAGSDALHLPIIPLCGRRLQPGATEADENGIEPLPEWPSGRLTQLHLGDLRKRIGARAAAVVKKGWGEYAGGLKPKLRDKAEAWIEDQGWMWRQVGRLGNAFRGRRIADAAEARAIAWLAEAATDAAMARIEAEVRAIDGK